ncbi:MAG: hypothetical protein K0S99_2424 [Thermomicrobiales bacterium]|nr:hypothetical protein [Thermomicrobiales bacterium]
MAQIHGTPAGRIPPISVVEFLLHVNRKSRIGVCHFDENALLTVASQFQAGISLPLFGRDRFHDAPFRIDRNSRAD